MSAPHGTTGVPDVVAGRVQRLAHLLLPQSSEIAAAVLEPVLHEVPEVAPRGPDIPTRSTEENIAAMLATLAFGLDPEAFGPPPTTLELIRQLVESDGDLNAVLRGYRIAHRRFWDVWAAHVGDHVDDRDELQAVLGASSASVFALFDSVVAGIVAFHATEVRRRTAANPGQRSTAAAIAGLLGPERVDLDAAGSLLRYDLRGHHVAVVVSPETPEGDAAAIADGLVAGLGGSSTVRCPAGDGTLWLWCGWSRAPDEDVLRKVAALQVGDAIVTLGQPGTGRTGFRTSHEQAVEALHLRRSATTPRVGVTLHRDVELAVLLCSDPVRALDFAGRRLGPLAADDPSAGRLRETLRTYFACGQNKARTAELLFVHQRTVSYRMARLEELLGSTVDQQSAELHAALIVLDVLRA